MTSIQQIQRDLPSIRRFGPGLVGVFVGGTSGIGESTAREFVRYSIEPRVYLIGRSQEQADRIQDEFRRINTGSDVRFIQSDVSELHNVDEVCKQIKAQENKINFLSLTAGIFHMRGREETKEGLDRKLSLDYYSRIRFTENLLPELRYAAATSSPTFETSKQLASVISVLGGGSESVIDTSDLSLKHNYSLSASTKHAVTMNTLTLDDLAKRTENSGISFFHTSPGMVKTNGHRELGSLFKLFLSGSIWAFGSWTVPVKECGERQLWAATCATWSGKGVHLVGKNSEIVGKPKVLNSLRDTISEQVVKHTEDVSKTIFETNAMAL